MEVIAIIATMLMSATAQAERDDIRSDLSDTQVEVIMNQQETDQLHKFIVQVDAEVFDINEELEAINADLSELEDMLLALSGSHASLYANNKIDHDQLTQMINNLHDRIKSVNARTQYLDDKIGILHP